MDFSSRIPPVIWMLVTVIAVIIGLALYGYLTGAWDHGVPECQ
jgi:hypothetical protein